MKRPARIVVECDFRTEANLTDLRIPAHTLKAAHWAASKAVQELEEHRDYLKSVTCWFKYDGGTLATFYLTIRFHSLGSNKTVKMESGISYPLDQLLSPLPWDYSFLRAALVAGPVESVGRYMERMSTPAT